MSLSIGSASLAANGLALTVNIAGGTSPILPATAVTGFIVRANGVPQAQASATAAAAAITITLSSAIDASSVLTLDYAPGNVHDSAGTPLTLGTFTGQAVTNNSTVSSHATLTASAALATDGKTITATIGGSPVLPLNPVPAFGNPHGFTFYDDGAAVVIADSFTASSTVVFKLATPVSGGATLTWGYTPGNITDHATPPSTLHFYGNQTVTNNSTIGPSVPTGLTGSIVSKTNRISFTVDPDAISVKVFKDGSGTALATVSAPTALYDDVVTDGLAHYYRISSVYSTHVGSLSGILHFPAVSHVVSLGDTTEDELSETQVKVDRNPTV